MATTSSTTVRVFAGIVACAALSACTVPQLVQEPATVEVNRNSSAVAHLSQAINYRTISDPEDTNANLGQFQAFRHFLRSTYPIIFHAADTEELAGGTLLLTWRGQDPSLDPLILMAHQDVVPAGDGDWTYPPFSGTTAGGYVWGRGSLDLKGQLIAILEAAESLAATQVRPDRTVIFIFGHDEETFGTGASAAADRLAARGVRPWMVLDEGPPVVTDFELAQRPVALVAVAEKGFLTVRVTAQGVPGHTAVPPRPSAVEDLVAAITRIEQIQFRASLQTQPTLDTLRALGQNIGGLRGFVVSRPAIFGPILLRQFSSVPETAALLSTTGTPIFLRAGERDNVVPGTAMALINFRVHPIDSVGGVLRSIEDAVAPLGTVTIEVIPGWSEPSPVAPTAGDAFNALSEAILTVAPGTPIIPVLLAGTTDSRYLNGLGGPIYRFSPAVITTEILGTIHGTDERIAVEDLFRAIAFYRSLISGE